MTTKTKKEMDELLMYGYIRCDIGINNDDIPLDIMNLCMKFYHLNFELLPFSQEFCSDDTYQFTENNQCITVIADNHKFIVADVEPVTTGVHCWRVQVDFCYVQEYINNA